MEIATRSCGYAMLTTVSFLGMEETTEEILVWATSHPKIIEAASIICRLMDDIVGSEVYLRLPLLFFSTREFTKKISTEKVIYFMEEHA